MKQKKIIALLLSVFIMATLFISCSGGGETTSSSSDEVIELKLGHIQSENDVWQEGALKFKEEVEEKSNGSIKVTIYPNSTLGGDRDMAEGMQMGTIDMALIAGVLGNFEPSIQLLELPYLFDSEEAYKKVIDGEVGQEIVDRVLDSSGIRILNFWDRGPRHVSSNRPIETLEDIKGLKIRIPEIQAMEVTWEAMEASPTTMAWNEVYTALEQNIIDAQENPITFMYSGRIHEVQDYLALTAHKYEYVTLSISDSTWTKLSEEQKEIVADSANAATEFENNLVKEETEKLLEDMKQAGVTVTNPDIEGFSKVAKTAHEDFAKTIDKDLYKRIIKAIEE